MIAVTVAIAALGLGGCSLQHNVKSEASSENLDSPKTLKEYDRQSSALAPETASDLFARMRIGYSLDLDHKHANVDQHLKWILKHPRYLERLSERSAPYLYYILTELEANGIPSEIALLPMVESAYDPFAYSHGRAAGLWQFIPSTGHLYGLKQDWWFEGRRDVRLSTQAAISFLKYLNKTFDGDWLLALAAYNSGPGTVLRAMKRNAKLGKPTDFWSLKLPRETRDYVPKLIALAKVVQSPKQYQLALPNIPNKPYFAVVNANSQIDLDQAAKLAGISTKEMYQLNPAFNQWATHPEGPHELLVPIDSADRFETQVASLSKEERVRWLRYKIKSGDSLISIAKTFKTTPAVLKQVNHLSSHLIQSGKTLLIPTAMKSGSVYSLSMHQRLKSKQNKVRTGRTKQTYVVKAGDSFWKIAKQFNVKVSELARWNNLAPKDSIKPNQTLAIWTKAPKTSPNSIVKKIFYSVRNGDSLARIADKFSVRINDLKSWNQLQNHKYIHPGQKLVLYVDVTQLNG